METTARGIGCEGQHEIGCCLEFDFGTDFPEGIKGIYSIRFGAKAFSAIYFDSFPRKQLWRRATDNFSDPEMEDKKRQHSVPWPTANMTSGSEALSPLQAW